MKTTMIHPFRQTPRWKPVHFEESRNIFYGDLSLGNATMFRVLLCPAGAGLFVGVERKGAFTFPANGWLHYAYVKEKLDLTEADARNLADFINVQIGFGEHEEQGEYRHIEWDDPKPEPKPVHSEFVEKLKKMDE